MLSIQAVYDRAARITKCSSLELESCSCPRFEADPSREARDAHHDDFCSLAQRPIVIGHRGASGYRPESLFAGLRGDFPAELKLFYNLGLDGLFTDQSAVAVGVRTGLPLCDERWSVVIPPATVRVSRLAPSDDMGVACDGRGRRRRHVRRRSAWSSTPIDALLGTS